VYCVVLHCDVQRNGEVLGSCSVVLLVVRCFRNNGDSIDVPAAVNVVFVSEKFNITLMSRWCVFIRDCSVV
jgi:hypothetical protein